LPERRRTPKTDNDHQGNKPAQLQTSDTESIERLNKDLHATRSSGCEGPLPRG
jgi:hypothetical protein